MNVQITETNWLSGTKVKELGITELLIIDEAMPKESEYQGKKQQKTVCRVQTGSDVYNWSMNDTCKNALIRAYGEDTKDWIGKTIPIETSPSSGGYRAILPNTDKLPNQKATNQAKITA